MSVDTFTLNAERKVGYAILRTDGYVNNLGGEKIAEQANQLIDEGFRYLVLNLEKSQVVNSIGISILIEVIERMVEEEGGRIGFCHLTKTIAKTFQIMGLTQYAQIYDNEADAERAAHEQ
jgi:anti-anti-sigma factor